MLAGPEEATVIGNLAVQALALGELASLDEARRVVRASFALDRRTSPAPSAAWSDARARFDRLTEAPQEAVSR